MPPADAFSPTGLNLGAHKEAAEHFLSTLVMQDADGTGTKSDQVWTTLGKTFVAMVRSQPSVLRAFPLTFRALALQDRLDLADRARAGADLEVFRREGFDF